MISNFCFSCWLNWWDKQGSLWWVKGTGSPPPNPVTERGGSESGPCLSLGSSSALLPQGPLGRGVRSGGSHGAGQHSHRLASWGKQGLWLLWTPGWGARKMLVKDKSVPVPSHTNARTHTHTCMHTHIPWAGAHQHLRNTRFNLYTRVQERSVCREVWREAGVHPEGSRGWRAEQTQGGVG